MLSSLIIFQKAELNNNFLGIHKKDIYKTGVAIA